MSEFGSNQEFHPSGPVLSKHYNYTVDYFELRAQPGRDGAGLPTDQFWYRDETNGLLYPLYLDDEVIIGGTSLRGSESLRVVGDIDATGLIMGSSYIRETTGQLTFYDASWGSTVTLTDLMTSYWTRNDTEGWIWTSNNDKLLIGGITGSNLRNIASIS